MKRRHLESLNLSLYQILIILVLAILPSFIKTRIYRMAGARLGKGVSLAFGTIILADGFNSIEIGDYSSVRSFSIILCSEISIGDYSEIAPFVWIWGAGRLKVGNKCYIGPRSIVNLRRNDFIMGEYSGVGPSSVIYTHGQWLPYTEGWPRKYGDVVLEDHVWVPARVFISPGVRIGSRSIIGSGAVVSKDIPPGVFAAGVPAKVISEVNDFIDEIDEEELYNRVIEIVYDLFDYFDFRMDDREELDFGCVFSFIEKSFIKNVHWKIIVLKPTIKDISCIDGFSSNNNVIFFTLSDGSCELKKGFQYWFDLKNLVCSSIDNNFIRNIWFYLRETWCITCNVEGP